MTEPHKKPMLVDQMIATAAFVEDILRERLSGCSFLTDAADVQVEDIIGDVGLRIRPFLFELSYEASGLVLDGARSAAAALELLQASTLIIDDVLDHSNLRNSKPSIVCRFGSEQAVTIGTIMSSVAGELFCKGLRECSSCHDAIPAAGLFLRTQRQIYTGQLRDLLQEDKQDLSEAEYYDMVYLTTGSFIEASLVMGALLWNAPETLTTSLHNIGRNLGIAYQIRDDVIDLLGDSELTGKPVAGDVRQRKMRLPIIHALNTATDNDSAIIRELYSKDRVLKDDEVAKIVDILTSSGAIEYSIERTKVYCQRAAEDVDNLMETSKELADNLVALTALISEFE